MEAGGGVGDACPGLSDADINGPSLAAEVGFGTEVAGSESRVDVALKDESVGVAGSLGGKSVLEEVLAHVLNLKATISKVSGSVVAEFSAGVIDSEVVQHLMTRSLRVMLWSGSMSCGGPAKRLTRCNSIRMAGLKWPCLMWTNLSLWW